MKSVGNLTHFFIYLLLLESCNSFKKIVGTYRPEKVDLISVTLNLNRDRTFVEYVSTELCKGTYYFGSYTKKSNHIILSTLYPDVSYLNKNDTIIYNYFGMYKKRTIFLYENEFVECGDARILIGNNSFLTDNNGQVDIPANIKIDSLIIEQSGFVRTLKIDSSKLFNQLFIMIYDYTLERCSHFYFENKFLIKGEKIKVLRENEKQIPKNRSLYLRKVTE